jgi:hypothetical protein
MIFFRRNKQPLVVLAALVFASVLVLRQFMANQAAHIELREDFVLLIEHTEEKSASRLYQLLVQELPNLSDMALVEDLQRTFMVLNTNSPAADNLVWKYQVSVKNELQKRSEKRIARARARALIP